MPDAELTSQPSSSLRAALAAVAFLTRIPVGRLTELDSRDVARGAPLYPLVGAGVGALVGLTAKQLEHPLGPALAAGLALLVGALVTGALHLDALADCADALGGHSREQALQIMRDHAIGAYGAAALILDLLIKGAALAALARTGHIVAAAAAAGALSRGAPVLLASTLPYARSQGTAAALTRQGSSGGAAASTLVAVTIAAALLAGSGVIVVVVVVAAAAATTVAAGVLCRAWLGGVTGDTLGATTEVVETMMLVLAVALA
ncbi:MAG: adenosylcobinamide-GDP ribazoletransferase [Sphingomonadales bacterium]|jgi:cobalamin 5'-phosphate synthase/cobalamin synthase|nr:adenosylcobinamide-GDP ribazoletransferase [Sphingomonadales bacterium]